VHFGPVDVVCALMHHTCRVDRCCHNAAECIEHKPGSAAEGTGGGQQARSLQRAQAVVSPFTTEIVHRQVGLLQLFLSIHSSIHVQSVDTKLSQTCARFWFCFNTISIAQGYENGNMHHMIRFGKRNHLAQKNRLWKPASKSKVQCSLCAAHVG